MKKLIVALMLAMPVFAADEMRKLDWMIGDWTGEASIQMGGPEKHKSLMTEHIQSRLGGKAILIEGLGKSATGEITHDALGVIWYDEAAKKYQFSAWTARYGHTDAWFEVGEKDTAQWGFDIPQGGKIRYSISRSEKGEWREVGHFSRDGKEWLPFFEMTLRK